MGSPENETHFNSEQDKDSPFMDDRQRIELLRSARSAIENNLRGGKPLITKTNAASIPSKTSIFVTLWGKNSSRTSESFNESTVLRGCIGQMQSDLPVSELVQDVAIGAASRDPRFPALMLSELDTINIEISILSPLRVVKDLQQIVIGRDGLMIEGLGKRGLLLPKVPVRLGWDRDSLFRGVCNKAGLSVDCWPGACNLYTFTTLVFTEEEMYQ